MSIAHPPGAGGVRPPDLLEKRIAACLFAAALIFHAWGATVGWSSRNLPGCEFRQTQTAISALFIQRESNFSLAYPTPVLGKPWSIPMEFPLYQWTVVAVSNVTGMELTQAGRTVSLACFYLGLPAWYLLLARLRLPRSRRLVALAFVLCCPLYIFYARAFLIETMAWMFGSWFLLGYVRAAEDRSLAWIAVAAAAGVGAGLTKITTLLFFLLPAMFWTVYWFWQDLRSSGGKRARRILKRVGWCALAVLMPGIASVWWVEYSDAVKAQSVAGAFLQSDGMFGYNFGVGVRWDAEVWRPHWRILFDELASAPVLVVAAALAIGFARRWWALIAMLVFCFFAVQAVMPILYAWHEYYYVANAMTLMLAIGLAAVGMLESRLPRGAVWLAIVGLVATQGATYVSFYYPGQKQLSAGGNPIARALKEVTDPDDVVVFAGDDWSSITPYFAERRAMMIRRKLETTWDMIHPAFQALKGEQVTALVLYGPQQQNQLLLDTVSLYFRIDPRPVARWENAAIYLHEQLRTEARVLAALAATAGIQVESDVAGQGSVLAGKWWRLEDLLPPLRRKFDGMQPQPEAFFATVAPERIEVGSKPFLLAHPQANFRFAMPAGARRLTAEVALDPQAYEDAVSWGDRSDGVEVQIVALAADGEERLLLGRHVNPRDRVEDRGVQVIAVDLALAEGTAVELRVGPGPHGSGARDWSVLGAVRIE